MNLIQTAKLFLQRGNRRVIELYDEKLQKPILLGNENIRSEKAWARALTRAGFEMKGNDLKYIRFYLPVAARRFADAEALVAAENKLTSPLLKWFFFFGINFVAVRPAR